MWYTAFGAIATILVALLGTFITGANNSSSVDKRLLAPCIRKYIQEKQVKRTNRKFQFEQNDSAIPEVDEGGSTTNEKESAL